MWFWQSRLWPPFRAGVGCAALAVLQAAIRLIYPLVALLFVSERELAALALLGANLLLSLLRSALASSTAHHVRVHLYGCLGSAIAELPAVLPEGAPPFEQLETQIARGIPWVESHMVQTWPALIGNALACPVVLVLATREVGLRGAVLGAVLLLGAVSVGAVTARVAGRAADRAWADYQGIASLIERGLRGRVELRAHGLSTAHRQRLAQRVAGWSRLDLRVRLLGGLTGLSAPLCALALSLALAQVFGLEAVPWLLGLVSPSTGDGARAGLLLAGALPILLTTSRYLADLSIERSYVAALQDFLALPGEASLPAQPTLAASDTIAFREVEFCYPSATANTAVSVRAHFSWRAAESIALMGPNGCGKTTVALSLLGGLAPDRGTLSLENAGVERPFRSLAGQVAYLSQDGYFDDSESVRDAVGFVAPSLSDAEVNTMLASLGLCSDAGAPLLSTRVATLSSGQRRLVALARVLLRDAALVILDEPEANLGGAARARVLAVIHHIARRRRLLILTHDPEFAAVADRILRFDGQHAVRE